MKIGLAYDLKSEVPLSGIMPDDALEEYDSNETIQALARTLEDLGHSVVQLGGGPALLERVLREPVDLVFNIAEGRGTYRSREAQVPGVLEMLGIPYTGSDPTCLCICLDKPLTKTLLKAAGICTPNWQVVRNLGEVDRLQTDGVPLPAFVKPAFEGSSKGILTCSKAVTLDEAQQLARDILSRYRQPAMIEEFIPGHEITVGVMDSPPRPAGIMRVLPRNGHNPDFTYTLEVKRDWQNLVRYDCPAQLPPQTIRDIERAALRAFAVFQCKDVARVDFRVTLEGVPYLIEINPLPGLRPGYGDLPIMAAAMGCEYRDLIRQILDSALSRHDLWATK